MTERGGFNDSDDKEEEDGTEESRIEEEGRR